MRQIVGVPPHPDERAKLERALEPVRLGPAAPAASIAWMKGWSLTFDEAIAYALGQIT